jgi:hypothetical protein
MADIIPLPIANIDMQLAEIGALVQNLIAVGENTEDVDYLRLRGSNIALLYIITDKCKSADRSIPHLYKRGRS